MLKTKSILAPKENSDGLRISIMSRHTLNDGTTPDSRITRLSYNLWERILAPPEDLLGDYYKRSLPWKNFEKRYLEYLRQPDIQIKVQNIAETGLGNSLITLLCVEDSPEKCHRRLLAEECKRYQPELVLDIK